jgi:hypothetical protein
MRTLRLIFAVAGLITFANGCATRTVVLDSQSDVVRLGEDVRGTIYMWQDGQWRKSGKVKLPEGWYAGPGPR